MKFSGLDNTQELATAGGVGLADEYEPVFLRLTSARRASENASKKVVQKDLDATPHQGHCDPVIDLKVMPYFTWQVVKRMFQGKWYAFRHVPDADIRLLYKSVELGNNTLVNDYQMAGGVSDKPAEIQYLLIRRGDDNGGKDNIDFYLAAQVPTTGHLKQRASACLAALTLGIMPRLTEDGTGATYLLKDSRNKHVLAVYKPKDEEAFAPQNPRGYVGPENKDGLRSGVLSTQQAAREVAAYLLDHDNFAGVPETTLAHAMHPKFVKVDGKVVWKVGAFQSFVESKGPCGNYSSKTFSVQNVHRIGILDVRIINLDRNDGNLLVRQKRTAPNGQTPLEVVPIDHGLSLPCGLEVYLDEIVWMTWAHSKVPFGQTELDYIEKLDGKRDARTLSHTVGINEGPLRLMQITTLLLKLGAKKGLTLYDIGCILFRETFDDTKGLLEEEIEEGVKHVKLVEGQMPYQGPDGSPGLYGLDLSSTVTSRSQGSKRGLLLPNSGGDPLLLKPSTRRGDPLLMTPHMGPSSPQSSPHSNSPFDGHDPPVLCLDDFDNFDFDLSPLEDNANADKSSVAPTPAAAGKATTGPSVATLVAANGANRQTSTDGFDFAQGGTARRLHAKLRKDRKGGAPAEASAKSQQGNIWKRLNVTWTERFEKLLMQVMEQRLTDLINNKFGARIKENKSRVGSSQTRTARPDREDAQGGIVSIADAMPAVLADDQWTNFSSKPAKVRSFSDASSDEDGVLFDLGGEPAEAKDKSKDNARSIEEPLVATATETTAPEVAAPSKPKWVPAWKRKAEAEAAAAAAAAGETGASDEHGREQASEAPSASIGLCTSSQAWEYARNSPKLAVAEQGGTDRYGWSTNVGPRTTMEDAIDAQSRLEKCKIPTEFYAVYDGHSGQEAVKYVKRRLFSVICDHEGINNESRTAEVLRDAIKTTDEELCRLFDENPPAQGKIGNYVLSSGVVACVCLLRGETLYVANVGDCRAVLCVDGEMKQLTKDHRADDENPEEKQRLDDLGVEVTCDGYVNGKVAVSRAFGDYAFFAKEKCKGLIVDPEIFTIEIESGTEFLILGCDGIFERLSSTEVGKTARRSLRSDTSPQQAAKKIVELAKKTDCQDNLSAVVVSIHPPALPESREAPRLRFARKSQS